MAVSPRRGSPAGASDLRARRTILFSETLFSQSSVALGRATLALGIATALATAWVVHNSFSPILFFDQWGLVNALMQSNGHLSLAQLWQQHNEHRIPWGKLAAYADLEFFGGGNISLLIEIYAIQAMEAFFLTWIFRRYRKGNPAELFTAAGLFLFAMFYPIQIENFYWGFQVAFVTLPFAGAVSIGCAILHSEAAPSGGRPAWFSWPLAISLVAAITAETSLASGILVWPVLLLLSFVLGMPARTKGLIATVAALATGAFLWGFHSPGQAAKPLESLRHPIAVAEFVRACLAWSWDSSMPVAGLWPDLAQLCAMIAAAVVIGVFVWRARPSAQRDKLELFFAANGVFLLMTALVVALGRMNFGIVQAVASRYQTIALAFWASFGALLLLWGSSKGEHARRAIEVQVLFLLLILASVPRFFNSAAVAKAHQRSLAQAYQALLEDPENAEARSAISPYPNFAEAHAYLQSHHLGIPDREFPHIDGSLEPIGKPYLAKLQANGYQVLPADQCIGHLDSVRPAPGGPEMVQVSGWSWLLAPPARPRRMLLVLEDGTVMGSTRVSLPRPDVRRTVPGVTELNIGWRTKVALPPGRTLRVFAVANSSGGVCPIQNEFRRQ